MLKIKGFILTFSLLVVLVSSETVDNRTTPVNGRLSTPRPLAQEGSTAVRLGVTPGASSSTVSRPVTPVRVSSPERLDQTPSRSTLSTASRPPTPVARPQTPNPLDQSSTVSRPPTPSQSSSLRPTPSIPGGGSSTTLRPTPSPGNLPESSTSRTTRSTPFSSRSTPPGQSSSTTTTPLTSTTSGMKTTTSFFTPPIPNSTITTSFPSSSTSELTSTTSFPTSSSTSLSSSSLSSSASSSGSTTASSSGSTLTSSGSTLTSSGSTLTSSGSTLTSSTPSVSPSSSSPTSSTATPSSPSSSESTSTASTSTTSPTSTTVSTTTPTSSSPSSSTSTTTTTASTSTSTPSPGSNTPSSTTSSTSTPTTSTPTTTTTTTIVTSSSTVPNATPTQVVVPGQKTIHTQIKFCNNYYLLNINPASIDSYKTFLKTQIQNICGVADGNRIQNFQLVPDYDDNALIQFDVVPGPGMATDDIVVCIQNKVKTNTFTITDKNGAQLTVCDSTKVCPWTDHGICPDQMCQNGGTCNVAATCQYFCQCTSDWTGRYCEQRPEPVKKKQNLWLLWLLILPLALLLLLLLLCLFCCMNRCCVGAAAAPRQKIEIIEEDIYQDVGGCSEHGTVRSCRSVCSRPSIYAVNPNPMCVNDAGSTYYSALGRPFAVAFSDNTFSAVGYASNDAGIYNHCGKKVLPAASCCGDDEIEVIMNKPRRGSCCGSVYSETGSGYHSALGNRYAVAYNDRSFNTYSSMPRTCSIRHYN